MPPKRHTLPTAADPLDPIDRRALRALQEDGRLPNAALAERLGLSPSPCLRRLKRLEQAGVIQRYVAILDRSRVGFGLMAYVEVKVPQVANRQLVREFRAAVQQEPCIVGCHVTAGQFDFLLRVVARDMDHYARLAQDVLLRLPGVQDMRSTFVLDTVKDTTALPV